MWYGWQISSVVVYKLLYFENCYIRKRRNRPQCSPFLAFTVDTSDLKASEELGIRIRLLLLLLLHIALLGRT